MGMRGRALSLSLVVVTSCSSHGREPSLPTTSSAGSSSGDTSATTVQATTVSETPDLPGNHPPYFDPPGDFVIDEREPLTLEFDISDPDGDAVRVFVQGLPPGAVFDEANRRLEFTPDFIQGGHSWQVTAIADDGLERVVSTFTIEVSDTIRPPSPEVMSETSGDGLTRLFLHQTTDDFLDSPGYAGREFNAIVTAPDDADADDRRPVRIALHGFDGGPWDDGWSGEYRIAPHDPMNSYWWGFSESLPDAEPTGAVRAYTVRRVLHLLEWVLETYPGADPERVYLEGASMGGAGVLTIGLLHARHFAWVSATIAQAIPRNHRPSRMAQLAAYWGDPSLDLDDGEGNLVWDRMDLTRALLEQTEARNQLLFVKHGKDDPVIHFGAVVHTSPLTGRTFYQALQESAVGHLAVWDEGGHGDSDPLLGDGWWQTGWNPIFDTTSIARRDLAFPAFHRSILDRDPGTGDGNGLQPWDPETGYAGDVSVAGDSGWNGEIAGALGRGLRWKSTAIVDRIDRFAVPLRVLNGEGGLPPAPGYPTTGDRLDGGQPVLVDVTLRRVQAFHVLPGELLAWRFGAKEGEVQANERGEITIHDVPLSTDWTTLEFWRIASLSPG